MREEFFYILENVRCGRCRDRLPDTVIRTIVRDDDEIEAVDLARRGVINQVVCPRCGYLGVIMTPFLFVDRGLARAVFVTGATWAPDKIKSERERLLRIGLEDVGADLAELILARVQDADSHHEIPLALAVSDEEAAQENCGVQAFWRREGLPSQERLEQLLRDAEEHGTVYMAGFERSVEFLAVIDDALLRSNEALPNLNITVLKRIAEVLRPQLRPNDGVKDSFSSPTIAHDGSDIASFRSMLNLEEKRALDMVDGVIQLVDSQPSTNAPEAPAGSPVTGTDPNSKVARPLDRYWSLASAAFNSGRYKEAASLAQQLLTLARPIGPPEGITSALVLLAKALIQDDQVPQGLYYLEEANSRLAGKQLNSVEADLYGHVGEALGDGYGKLGELVASAENHLSAAAVFAHLGRLDGERHNLTKAGRTFIQLGEFEKAVECYTKALSKSPTDSREVVGTLITLAGVLAGTRKRPPVFQLRSEPAPATASTLENQQAEVDLEAEGLNLSPTEQENLRIGLAESLDHLPVVERDEAFQGLRAGRVIVKVYRGTQPEASLPDYEIALRDDAVRYVLRARRISEEHGFHELELQCYAQLTNIFLGYGMMVGARHSVEMCFARQQALGCPLDEEVMLTAATFWNDIAATSFGYGQRDDAYKQWTNCIEVSTQLLRGLSERDARYAEAKSQRAIALEATSQYREAADDYREAIGRFEGLRSSLQDVSQKRHVQSKSMKLFARAQRNLLTLSKSLAAGSREELLAEAYSYSEAGRARILLDDTARAIPPTDVSFDGFSPVRPLSLGEFGALLPEDTAIVQYSLIPTYCHRKGNWLTYVLLPGSGLDSVIESDLEEVFAAQAEVHEAFNETEAKLLALSREELSHVPADMILSDSSRIERGLERLGSLLLPAGLIDNLRKHNIRRLVFVPEAYLYDTPFVSLRVETGGRIDYLIGSSSSDGFETLVVPSASLYFQALQRAPQRSLGSMLCVSDPKGDLDGMSAWLESEVRMRWNWGPVSHLSSGHATADSVIESARHHDGLLYFGHGHYSDEDAMDSGLVLNDALLTARTLLQDDKREAIGNAALLLLLACSGARVDPERYWSAREHMGLSTALLSAGVVDVIGCTKIVWTAFAQMFSVAILDGIAAGLTTSEAYKQALNQIIGQDRSYRNPYLWGATRLTGAGCLRRSGNI